MTFWADPERLLGDEPGAVTQRGINDCTAGAPTVSDVSAMVRPCDQEVMAMTMEPLPLSPRGGVGP